MSQHQDEPLKTTPLRDRHVALGARLIPFAGWLMPVQYEGIIAEHRAVRSHAGLFDLGHMGQIAVTGSGSLDFLQYVTTNDVSVLEPGDAQYSMLPNHEGGVVDDIIVYREPSAGGYMVVVNASNRDKDVAWMRQFTQDFDVEMTDVSDETGMIAIQGPAAERITQREADIELARLGSFSWHAGNIAGVPAMIARTGYTGEDGFEFYTAIDRIGEVWDALMRSGAAEGIKPIGLGARDTLRLEARMPLYGQELAEDISPYEAGLGWAVKPEKGDFVGREAIRAVKRDGAARKTVGFRLTERSGSPRSHFLVRAEERDVGFVTSGAMSPTLGENLGLALIERDAAGVGRPLEIVIRDRPVPAVQVPLPFYNRA